MLRELIDGIRGGQSTFWIREPQGSLAHSLATPASPLSTLDCVLIDAQDRVAHDVR